MTPSPHLNASHSYTWAAVVSGMAWKHYTLEHGGLLAAEYTRGPLILWAKHPDSTKMPQSRGSVVSALEDRIDHLNGTQVFERFKWAVRGKVRHSVRWRSGEKVRNRRIAHAFAEISHSLKFTGSVLYPRIAKISRKPNKFAVYYRNGRTVVHRYSCYEGKDPFTGEIVTRGEVLSSGIEYKRVDGIMTLSHTFAPTLSEAIFLFISWIRSQKTAVLLPSLILMRFQAEEFRAHLRRHVKAHARRGRIRRPLHSRPRPPSAPLAPPVS